MTKLRMIGLLAVIAGVAGSLCGCGGSTANPRVVVREGDESDSFLSSEEYDEETLAEEVVEELVAVEEVADSIAYFDNVDAQETLRRDLEISNASLPSQISDGLTMEKLTYYNDIVTFTYVLDSDYFDESSLGDYLDAVKIAIFDDDEDIKSTMKMIKEAGASLRIVCRMDTGTSRSTVIPWSDL